MKMGKDNKQERYTEGKINGIQWVIKDREVFSMTTRILLRITVSFTKITSSVLDMPIWKYLQEIQVEIKVNG